MKLTKSLNSAKEKDALYNLPKTITKILKPPLPKIENIEDFYGEGICDIELQGQGSEKVITPSNKFDIYTRLEVLLGLELSGHTKTLTEASNLIDKLYKRYELQNKQQNKNALDKFNTQ